MTVRENLGSSVALASGRRSTVREFMGSSVRIFDTLAFAPSAAVASVDEAAGALVVRSMCVIIHDVYHVVVRAGRLSQDFSSRVNLISRPAGSSATLLDGIFQICYQNLILCCLEPTLERINFSFF